MARSTTAKKKAVSAKAEVGTKHAARASVRKAAPRAVAVTKARGLGANSDPVRARIIEGARRHFFAHGFRGVTMDDLAEELGMSKKTLYAHFSSKLVLLEAVIRDKLARATAAVESVFTGKENDFAGTLQRLLGHLRSEMEEIQPPFFRDIRREAPEMFAVVQAGRKAMIQRHFGQLLNEGRKSGMVRQDIPVEMLIEILIGAVDAIVIPQRMEEMATTPKVALLQIISVFLTGIATDEGRTLL